jgi:hypothetical protein
VRSLAGRPVLAIASSRRLAAPDPVHHQPADRGQQAGDGQDTEADDQDSEGDEADELGHRLSRGRVVVREVFASMRPTAGGR